MDYNRILILYKQRGLTQHELAKMAGVSVNSVSNIINNKNTTIDTLEKISKALDVPMVYWFQEEASLSPEVKGTESARTKAELKRMAAQIDDLIDDKRRLKRENDELREKMGLGKAVG